MTEPVEVVIRQEQKSTKTGLIQFFKLSLIEEKFSVQISAKINLVMKVSVRSFIDAILTGEPGEIKETTRALNTRFSIILIIIIKDGFYSLNPWAANIIH